MLRYQRRPEGLVHEIGLPAHRAMPDAYVTAHHLRDLLNRVPLSALIEWSAQPGLLPRVRSGPHRGNSWEQLGAEALEELARDRDIDVRFSAKTEIRRRSGSAISSEPVAPSQGRLL
jgi:exodeoxyribonuclease X